MKKTKWRNSVPYTAARDLEAAQVAGCRALISNLDVEARTFRLTASSEFKVRRTIPGIGTVDELLLHTPSAVDLSRFAPDAAAPLLFDHDTKRQVGVVLKAELVDRRLVVDVKVQRSAEGDQLLRDVEDGIRRNASVSYQVREIKVDESGDVPLVVGTKWQPWEVSILASGADPTVGIGRSMSDAIKNGNEDHMKKFKKKADGTLELDSEGNPIEIEIKADRARPEPGTKPVQVSIDSAREDARKDEQQRCREILAIGQRMGFAEEASKAVAEGTTLNEFRAQCLDIAHERSRQNPVQVIDLSKGDQQKFSLGRAIKALVEGDMSQAPFERELTEAYRKKGFLSRERSVYVPWKYIAQRDVLKGGTGANLIETQLVDSEYVEHLLSELVLMRAGMRTLGNFRGDIDIPVGSGSFGTAAYFASETTPAGEITPVFTKRSMSPNTMGAFVDMSRRMVQQSSPAIQGIVQTGLRDSLVELLERTGIASTGSATVPQGIIGTSGLTSTSAFNAASFTYADFLQLDTDLYNAKGVRRAPSIITNRAVRNHALGKERFGAGTGRGIASVIGDLAYVDGIPLYTTQEFPSDPDGSPTTPDNGLIYGDFSQFLLATWGDGIELTVDMTTLNLQGAVRIIGLFDHDFLVVRPEAFCVKDTITLS